MAAEKGLRDSRSMRTIAVVTLVFLPGTFVAVRHQKAVNSFCKL